MVQDFQVILLTVQDGVNQIEFSRLKINCNHSDNFHVYCNKGDTCNIDCLTNRACNGMNLHCNENCHVSKGM